MDEKHESLIDSSLFYCFVIINAVDSTLQFYIVPSKVVARYVAPRDFSRSLRKDVFLSFPTIC